jgi:AAA domain
MRRHYEVEGIATPFYIVKDMPRMGTNSGDAEILAKKIKAAVPAGTVIAAVAIDTLARAMTGASDNDSKDMGNFVANADAIAAELSCFVAAVHHSPRSDPTRGRGSNAADGAADVLISVVKNPDGTSTATIEELKDGEGSLTWRFRIVGTELQGRNQNLGCVGVLQPNGNIAKKASDDAGATKATKRLTPAESRFRTMLAEAVIDVGALVPLSGLVPPVPFNIKAVTRFQLKKSLLDAGFFEGVATKSVSGLLSKHINNLTGKYSIGANKQHVWLPE